MIRHQNGGPRKDFIMVLRIVVVAAVCVLACSHSHAADKTIPVDFIDEWCFASKENKITSYTLPSWTEGGLCTKILSIEQYVFYGEGRNCQPVNVSLTKNTAPSGTAYKATITAHCQADGPVTNSPPQTFEFNRYKGNLTVTEK
jgi:hypothetical protein